MSGTNKLVQSAAQLAGKSNEALAADLKNANEKAKTIESITCNCGATTVSKAGKK